MNQTPVMPTLLEMLQEDAWFSSCDSPLRAALIENAKACTFKPGEAIYRDGEIPSYALFCVLKGGVRLCNSLPDGSSSLLVYLEPYHWFGELSLIDGNPHVRDAIADVHSEVLCIPVPSFRQWLDDHPSYWRDVARLSVTKLRVAYQVIGEPGALHQRLAKRLWLMAHGFGSRAQNPSCSLLVSQELLAQMMGSTRQSISSALAKLESRGLLSQSYKAIELTDLVALLDHANHYEC